MYSTDIVVYGAEVWCMDYLFKNTARWESSLLNFLLEEVHIRFLKIIMGLHKSAVNIAVYNCRKPGASQWQSMALKYYSVLVSPGQPKR